MNSNDEQLAEPTVLFKGLVGKIPPNVGRCLIAPGGLESHAFRLAPELPGSALLDLHSGALLAIPALKIPDVPAEPNVAPFKDVRSAPASGGLYVRRAASRRDQAVA